MATITRLESLAGVRIPDTPLAKAATALAISSAWAKRPIGILPLMTVCKAGGTAKIQYQVPC
jgi:hypothetical protein